MNSLSAATEKINPKYNETIFHKIKQMQSRVGVSLTVVSLTVVSAAFVVYMV